MDFRHLIVTCLFSKLRLPFDNQKVKENYAIFLRNSAGIFYQLFHGLLHYPLLVVAQIHSHQRIQNQFNLLFVVGIQTEIHYFYIIVQWEI